MFTLSEALEAIKNKPEFSVKDRGSYTVIDYNLNSKTTFIGNTERESMILLNLRGTAFNNSTGEICRLGYHKFFNYGEFPETDAKLDFSCKHIIMQKLDGSLLYPIMLDTKEEYVWGTRAGVTDVSKMAVSFLENHPKKEDYDSFVTFCLELGYTPMFEFCSRQNRIVIDYPESQLVLTGIRSMVTGMYVPHDAMVDVASMYGIPSVKSYSSISQSDFDQFLQTISDLKDDEGIVIRFEDGPLVDHMVKKKSTNYIKMHRAIDSTGWEHDGIQLILSGLIDDIIPILPPTRGKEIQEYASGLIESICTTRDKIVLEYKKYSHIESQKDFALAITSNQYKQFMFSMRSKGSDPLDLLMTWCKKTGTNQAGTIEMKRMISYEVKY